MPATTSARHVALPLDFSAQAFIEVLRTDATELAFSPSFGVLGLGYPSAAVNGTSPFFDSLLQQVSPPCFCPCCACSSLCPGRAKPLARSGQARLDAKMFALFLDRQHGRSGGLKC